MAASQTTAMQDSVTGVLTLSGWQERLSGGNLTTTGSMVAIYVTGVGGLQQKFGHAASDAFLREIVHRVQPAIPHSGLLVRDNENTFIAWLPQANDNIASEFIAHIRQLVCTAPIRLPESEPVQAKIVLTTIAVPTGTPVNSAVQNLERQLVHQPEFSAPPVGIQRATSARTEIDHRLAAVSLFGRDHLIERILASLKLPAPLPQTVILIGPPQAGKTRMLNSLAKLFGGQRLPIAEITCRPTDQAMSCTLLAAMLYQFFTAYPSETLQQRFAGVMRDHPWLPRLFPTLGEVESAPNLPEETAQLHRVLQEILTEMARQIPHIAIVHSLHLADRDSLAVLSALQAMPGHGLRIVAGVDPAEDGRSVPEAASGFVASGATVLPLMPLTKEQLRTFVQELLPEINAAELGESLYDITGGLPLAIEMSLRTWASDGVLDYQDDRFAFLPARITTSSSTLSEEDHLRLCKAALAGPMPLAFLRSLWSTTNEAARATVENGRQLGYISPIDFNTPDLVQFVDQEHANALLQGMDAQTRTALHGEIAGLLKSTYAEDTQPYARDLAYHFAQAGMAEDAAKYLKQLQLTAPALTPILVSPQTSPIGGIEAWDIPPATPIEVNEIDKLIEAALTLRLAGVQYRLYPATSDMAQTANHTALAALRKLFFKRPSLIMTYDGRTVAFDGQIFQRRDLQVAMKDLITWMSSCNLRAIGIAASVREYELARFMQAFSTFETSDVQADFLQKVALLNLTNIKVLTRSFQPDLPQLNMPMGGGISLPGQSPSAPAGEHDSVIDHLQSRASVPPVMPTIATGDAVPGDTDSIQIPTMADPEAIDDRTWKRLPELIEETPATGRRIMMTNLARWLGEQDHVADEQTSHNVDRLLINRLQQEQDRQTLREAVAAIEHRLQQLMRQRDWKGAIAILEPLRARLHDEQIAEVRLLLTQVLERIGVGIALHGLIAQAMEQPGNLDSARRVVGLLGEHAMRPLINELKNNTVMQERNILMQLLREFGDMQQQMILDELRAANPWYVYRNLLQVLAEVGTEESLAAIGEKITHNDPRVRAESVYAAVKVAKDNAAIYVMQGLDDSDANVRARAATLLSFCPEDRVLEIVLPLLQVRFSKDESDAAQLAAVLGLGYFKQEAARDALRQIIHPRIFSPYRNKSDEVRSAAVSALAQHLPHPAAEATIKQAMNDRNPQVRQNARRIWHQYQVRSKSDASA